MTRRGRGQYNTYNRGKNKISLITIMSLERIEWSNLLLRADEEEYDVNHLKNNDILHFVS